QHVPELIDPDVRRMLSEKHRHEAGVLSELKAFDLQVMLRNADPGEAALVAHARVRGDLVEHPLIEHRILAGHAALELVPSPDRDVHERVEVHLPSASRRAHANSTWALMAIVPSGVTAHSSHPR